MFNLRRGASAAVGLHAKQSKIKRHTQRRVLFDETEPFGYPSFGPGSFMATLVGFGIIIRLSLIETFFD